jgi:hypothetical protein
MSAYNEYDNNGVVSDDLATALALLSPRDGVVTAERLTVWPAGFDAQDDGYDADGQIAHDNQAAAAEAADEAALQEPQDLLLDESQLGLPEGATDLPAVDVSLSGVSTLAPGARFANEADLPDDLDVGIDTVDALAVVQFWSDIMRDHMHFLGMWLIDTPVPASGISGSGGEEDHAQEAGVFKQTARDLEAAWTAYIDGPLAQGDLATMSLAQLIGQTGLLKNRILAAIRAGQYVGGVYETFLFDNLTEVDYFVDALAGQVGGQAEVDMWNEHARGHALLDAHMLDPLMVKEIIEALVLAERFLAVSDGLPREPLFAPRAFDVLAANPSPSDIIEESMQWLATIASSPAAASNAYLEALQAIRARMEGNGARVSGVMPHRLVVHTIREIAYGLERIRQIQGEQ